MSNALAADIRDTAPRAPATTTRTHSGEMIVRMLRMIAMLPRSPGKITAGEIRERLRAEGHLVTARTIERDLHRLRGVLGLDVDDTHKPYGWSWDRKLGSELVD